MATTYYNAIQQLYVAYFNRPADYQGQIYWEGVVEAANGSTAAVSAAFAASAEYKANYAGLDNFHVLGQIYQNLFGHAADLPGLTYWAAQLQAKVFTIDQAVTAIAAGAQGTDLATYNNRVTAAAAFTTALDTGAKVLAYSGDAANASAKSFIAGVTDATSLAAAIAPAALAASIASMSNVSVPTVTFALTSGLDTLTGTTGTDIFVADNTGATKVTSVTDTLNGGAGTDTFKVYQSATDIVGGFSMPTLNSVENLYLNGGLLTTANTFDASGSGATSVAIDSPAAAMAVGATFTIKTAANQSLSLTKIAGTVGGSTIALNGAPSVTVNGLGTSLSLDLTSAGTSLGIVTTGASSTLTLANTGAALATLNISGDKNLSLTDSLAGLKTINASAATGNVTVDKTGIAANAAFAFTGGSGNDTLKLKAGDFALLTSGAQLDGGAGTGDKLAILDTTLATADYAKINAVKGFEILGLNAAITVDASQVTSISQFSVDTGALTQTISNMNAGNVTTITASPTSLTLGVAVGVNAETINLGTSTSAGLTATTLVTTGATTVNLSSNGTAANTITTLANSDNTNLVITGSADLTITSALAGTTTGSKVDASAFSGKLSVTGTNKGDILIGGSGADTLIAGTTASTLTGGAGADNFKVGSTVYGAGAQVDTITDFTKGADTLTLVVKGTAAFAATAVNVTAATSFATALNSAVAALADGSTNGQVNWFQFGGNTYVVESQSIVHATVAATDLVVKLTGAVDMSTLTLVGATSVLG